MLVNQRSCQWCCCSATDHRSTVGGNGAVITIESEALLLPMVAMLQWCHRLLYRTVAVGTGPKQQSLQRPPTVRRIDCVTGTRRSTITTTATADTGRCAVVGCIGAVVTIGIVALSSLTGCRSVTGTGYHQRRHVPQLPATTATSDGYHW
ncbi:hypothetical protein PSAC2689_40298 [Paraburkholderia sacchari]